MQTRRDDVGKRNDQDTTELPTPGALTGTQVVTYSLKEPHDANVIKRGGGGADSTKGVGGAETHEYDGQKGKKGNERRPLNGRGKRKSKRVGETNPDGVTRLWFKRLFLRGKEESRVLTMELENVAG